MSRYAIYGVTQLEVEQSGGKNPTPGDAIGIVFADLDEQSISKLTSKGFRCVKVGKVVPTDGTPMRPLTTFGDVSPPKPIPATATYTPLELLNFAGLSDVRDVTDPPLYGENMSVAVIDSGIRTTHQLLEGRVVYNKNFTSSLGSTDVFNHGTGVAYCIHVAGPKANILNLKAISDDGVGTEEAVALAVNECILLHDQQVDFAPSVINLSIGAPDTGDPNDIMRVACRAALERNIKIVAACGNEGTSMSITTPAVEQYVTAVGSIKAPTFLISSFSSRGPTTEGLIKPDVVLFGEDIVVASAASDTATTGKTGTSFACPIGSGVVIITEEGLIRQVDYPQGVPKGLDPTAQPPLTPEAMNDFWIPRVCVKPEGVSANKDNAYGWGTPYGALFTELIGGVGGLDVMSLLAPMMMIAMMGVMMKTMSTKRL